MKVTVSIEIEIVSSDDPSVKHPESGNVIQPCIHFPVNTRRN